MQKQLFPTTDEIENGETVNGMCLRKRKSRGEGSVERSKKRTRTAEGAEKEGFELGNEKNAAVAVASTADVGVLEKGGEEPGNVVDGGVAMCVAGPESLVREAANAAGRLGPGEDESLDERRSLAATRNPAVISAGSR